jgi:hypothetical protein
MSRVLALFLAFIVGLTTFCCTPPPPGSLLHPVSNVRLSQEPKYTIAVAPPVDRRPTVEREGSSPETNFFFTLIFIWWSEKRGNWVTDDFLCSPRAMSELFDLEAAYLRRTGVFTAVHQGKAAADFLLESEVIHLYGTYYEARRTIVAISKDSLGGSYEQSNEKTAFAGYGNAVIRYRLFDTRQGQPQLVWQTSELGTAQLPPDEDNRTVIGLVARQATQRALTSLALHLTNAVQDYARSTFDPFDRKAYLKTLEQQAAAGALQFVIGRASRNRTASELLTIAHPAGRIAGHRIVNNTTLPVGRPGEWLLSRERVDGTSMPYVEYATLANFLARFYELRRVDEMYHYHFFGLLPQAAPAAEKTVENIQ